MFLNFETRHNRPNEIIEMEDVELDDDEEFRSHYQQQTQIQPISQQNKQTPLFKIEPRSKNHINAAAKMVVSDSKTKQKQETGYKPQNLDDVDTYGKNPVEPVFQQQQQQQPEPVKYQYTRITQNTNSNSNSNTSTQRSETELKKPIKPKVQGRLLSNISNIVPKANPSLEDNQFLIGAQNIPERKRAAFAAVSQNQKDDLMGGEAVDAPRIPKRKLMQQQQQQNDDADPFAFDANGLPPIDEPKKPRSKLLGSLF